MSNRFAIALIALIPLALCAQEGRGTIAGRVLDSTGAVISGATIRAVNQHTGAAASARGNEAGNYTIPYLLPGSYNFTAEYAGFKTLERRNIGVRVNDVLNLDLELQIGNAAESIEVKGGAPLLESASVSVGKVVDQRRIDELPLQAGNAEELTLTAPGVVNTTEFARAKPRSPTLPRNSAPTATPFTQTSTPSTVSPTPSPPAAIHSWPSSLRRPPSAPGFSQASARQGGSLDELSGVYKARDRCRAAPSSR